MTTIIRAIVCCLLCATVFAQSPYRIGDARTIGRVDVSAQLPEGIATNCVLLIKPTFNDGTNYYSLESNKNNGNATNAASQPLWAPTNNMAACLRFDGVGDGIFFPATLSLTNMQSFSVAVLNYTVGFASAYNFLVGQRDNVKGSDTWVLSTSASGIALSIYDPQRDYMFRSASSGFVSNDWQFSGATYDGSSTTNGIRIYSALGARMDDGGGASGTWNSITNSRCPLSIGNGNYSGNIKHNGFIGAVVMFNRTLTAAEMVSVYSWMNRLCGGALTK